MRLLLAALTVALATSTPAAAAPPVETTAIRGATVPQLRADRAYLLFRIPRMKGANALEPLFMRVPTPEETRRYEAARAAAYAKALPGLTKAYEEAMRKRAGMLASADEDAPVPPSVETFAFAWDAVANITAVDFGDALVKTETENTYLVEAVPGEYVLYGMSPAMGLPRMVVCFCLGTVGFSAPAGQVTDLGYVISDLARSRSVVPELAAETGYGPSSDVGIYVMTAGTVRPVRADSSRPAALAGQAVVPAKYRAIGRYFTPNAMGINRLVPVPGVLDYRDGRVVDVATGAVVPDNL